MGKICSSVFIVSRLFNYTATAATTTKRVARARLYVCACAIGGECKDISEANGIRLLFQFIRATNARIAATSSAKYLAAMAWCQLVQISRYFHCATFFLGPILVNNQFYTSTTETLTLIFRWTTSMLFVYIRPIQSNRSELWSFE